MKKTLLINKLNYHQGGEIVKNFVKLIYAYLPKGPPKTVINDSFILKKQRYSSQSNDYNSYVMRKGCFTSIRVPGDPSSWTRPL